MATFKIGITEAGDAGLDLSWVDKLNQVDGAILISKNLTPAFCEKALEYKDKLIIHATITGWGGTILEPNIPKPPVQINQILSLIHNGFPANKIVIRIDPIIPYGKGCVRALYIFENLIRLGFNRYRVSILDTYPHVCQRFNEQCLPLPYGNSFYPSPRQLREVNNTLLDAKRYFKILYPDRTIRIEVCAEPYLEEAIQCGCISKYDLDLLNLHEGYVDHMGFQRKNCLCYSGKKELLSNKCQCPYQCLYCYWK